MKILFKYPTRQRPDMFKKVLDKYYSMLSGLHEYEFVISLDIDDMSMSDPEMLAYMNSKPNLSYYHGNNQNKVQAINADLQGKVFDILFLISDDMDPIISGFDDIIAQDMIRHFPKLDGVLHYNDGRVGKRLNTLSIMGRLIYEQWGYIYHPDYVSLWCDNEFQSVSEASGKSAYIDKVIVKHDWENFSDALRKKNEAFYNTDRAVFNMRKAAGFPRESVKPSRCKSGACGPRVTRPFKQVRVVRLPKPPGSP